MDFALTDYIVFIAYCTLIVGMGLWVSRNKGGKEKTSEDYFLASKALPWWAIGASLIASNISAEQFIGMSGSGFAIGLGIATYEWMAAITLLVLAKFILPIFLQKGIYTMPQFLENRYDGRVRTIMAVFWLLMYVFVNLTSVLYLGAISVENILGVEMWQAIAGLALFAFIYSVYGGLAAVAWTDVIQVIFLVAGGLVTTWLALEAVDPDGSSVVSGFSYLLEAANSKFDMILSPDHEYYSKLPGIWVIIGGMWVQNLSYWGFNQYITQRALAAKNLKEAQRGLVFAGYLKLLMPLIVVVPGIVAFVLYQEGTLGFDQQMMDNGEVKPDNAYSALLETFVPIGLKGAAFAALAAAIVSSLSSMINSTATIFTMDIYRNYINKNSSERALVTVGRIVSTLALITAALLCRKLRDFDQVFQYIQEFSGFVSPGVVAIFGLGIFWRKTTPNAAMWMAIFTGVLSPMTKYVFLPEWAFINRIGIVFLAICFIGIAISYFEQEGKDNKKGIVIPKGTFKTGKVFNVTSIILMIIIAYLYAIFW